MTRILYVTSLDPESPGGIQTLIRNQIRGLRELGHYVELLYVPASVTRSLLNFVPKVRYLRTQDNFPPKEWLRFAYYNHLEKRVSEKVNEVNPDVIHAGMIRCYPALRVATKMEIPSVLSTYAMELGNHRLANSAIRTADLIHCISQYTKGLVEGTVSSAETRVIPPSIDVERFQKMSSDKEKSGSVVTLARFVERKNISTLIDAWEVLDQDIIGDRNLIIMGGGPLEKQLKAKASEIPQIQFTGFVPEEQKIEYLASSDLFALVPTKNRLDIEGFGIVWIEAQAAGTPVVGSNYGGAPEAIGGGGIIVSQPTDVESVANAIERGLKKPPTTKEHLEKRVQKFDILPVATELERVYRQLSD